MKLEKLENNLLNIRLRDPVYKIAVDRILERLPGDLRAIADALPQAKVVGADSYWLHYSVYPVLRTEANPDQMLEAVRQWAHEYMQGEDFRRVRLLTTLDDATSLLYAAALTKAMLEKLREMLKEEVRRQGGGGPGLSLSQLLKRAGAGDEGAQEWLAQLCAKALEDLGGGDPGQGLKSLVASARAEAERAARVGRDVEQLVGGTAAGTEPGRLERVLDLSEKVLRVEWGERVLSLARSLADALPRFVHIKRARGRRGDELWGYAATRRVERALPRELALPDELFYARLASGGLLSRLKAEVTEGAYYVLVDKSGSMKSAKTVWARSVALALWQLARRKGRRYYLRLFDAVPHSCADDPVEALDMILTVAPGGGTDIDRALSAALEDLEALRGEASTIVIITDGEDEVSTPAEELRERGATLVAVMIRGDNPELRELAEASGGQYLTAVLTRDGALRVIEAARRA